jgi:hypothetical protein
LNGYGDRAGGRYRQLKAPSGPDSDMDGKVISSSGLVILLGATCLGVASGVGRPRIIDSGQKFARSEGAAALSKLELPIHGF